MPVYSHPITDIFGEETARAIFSKARDQNDQALIAFLWLTGARPSEILEITKEDITIEPTRIIILINTKKTHATGKRFLLIRRTLEVARPQENESNIFIETLIATYNRTEPGRMLIQRTTRWAELRTARLGLLAVGKSYAPYHFRHSVMTRESAAGHGGSELMHLKGAKSKRSVDMYVHALPYTVKVRNDPKN